MNRIHRPDRRTSVRLGQLSGSVSDMPALAAAGAAGPDLLSNLLLSLDLETNLVDSSGNGYNFTDQGSVSFSTGQTAGYGAAYHVAANVDYEDRTSVGLEIGNNEWACHLWVYNGGGPASTGIITSAGTVGFTTNASDSWALMYQSSIAKSLRFVAGKDPNTSGSATATSASNAFLASAWVPVLFWHDPNADVIGLQVNGAAAVTTAFSTGVRNGSSKVTIGGLTSGSQTGTFRIAAVRMWRGTGVINQIVNNSTALAFLNGQQRRHSELT